MNVRDYTYLFGIVSGNTDTGQMIICLDESIFQIDNVSALLVHFNGSMFS